MLRSLLGLLVSSALLLAPGVLSAAPHATPLTEPLLLSIRGRVVMVEVPAGFATVNLQALKAPPKGRPAPGAKAAQPQYKTIASKLMNGEAGRVKFILPRLIPGRNLQVYGVKPGQLPASLLTGATTFAPDDDSPQNGWTANTNGALIGNGGALSLSGASPSLLASSNSSIDTTARIVSESDIWKVDGDRLYFYNSTRGLQVLDIADADHPALLGTLRLPGAGEQMYLLDSSHVVLLKNEWFSLWWADWDSGWGGGGGIIFLGQPLFIHTNALTLNVGTTNVANVSAATLNTAGTLNLANATTATLANAGTLTLNNAGATSVTNAILPTLVSASSVSLVDAGSLSLTKVGSGTLRFSNASTTNYAAASDLALVAVGGSTNVIGALAATEPVHNVLAANSNLAGASLTLSASAANVQSAIGIVRSTAAAAEPHEVIVADVSAGAPEMVAHIPFEGSLQESRLVGKVLYLATNNYGFSTPGGPSHWGAQISSFDLSDPANPVARSTVFLNGWSSVITATERYFYAAVQDPYGYGTSVKILDITDPTGLIVEAGVAKAPGYVPDKFKIDEHGDVLTVVSTGWGLAGGTTWGSFNTVSTFSIADAAHPALLGTLEVAPNESLYATRFDGTRLYLVTAVQRRDPLEIIDLSDPARPTVLGTLEIPGFSTHIEPLGDRLVTIGLVGWQPSVALYDVGDAAHPRQLSAVSLAADSSWTSSEAVWNEKAFNVLPDQNLILLPVGGYDLSTGYATGVQLIDLLPERLAKRGVIKGQFSLRRAAPHRDRIVSISATNLVTVDASDRDHPAITANTEISWNVNRTHLAGNYLIELGGDYNYYSANSIATITVTPANAPDDSLATLDLPGSPIVSSELRDGILYVLQATGYGAFQSISEPAVRLTVIDVAHLPELKILGQAGADKMLSGYYPQVKPLWVNDRTLIFSAQDSQNWYGPRFYTTSLYGDGWNYWYAWGRTRSLLAFDVSTPADPKFASRLDLGGAEGWDVAAPLAASDSVYLGYKVVPRYIPEQVQPQDKASVEIPKLVEKANRHYLKVIDYSNAASPIVPDGGVNLPGELRALSRGGKLLYTVGRRWKLYDGTPGDPGYAVHASGFDGASAHLLDQLTLDSSSQTFVLAGEDLLLLKPQIAQTYQSYDKADALGSWGGWIDNPLKTTLETWTLSDEGKFAQLATLELDHEMALSDLNGLGVLRNNQRTIRLLDLRDPAKPLDLGAFTLEGYGSSSMDQASGDPTRGLWLPLGAYGVQVLSLGN